MKKRWIGISITVIAVVLFWWQQKTTPVASSAQPKIWKTLQQKSITSPPLVTPIPSSSQLSFNDCAAYWDWVSQHNAQEFIQVYFDKSVGISSRCQQWQSQNLFTKTVQSLLKNCEGQQQLIAHKSPCWQGLHLYRALITDRLFAAATDYEGVAPEILVNKILARFATENPPMDEISVMAEVLARKFPETYEFHKILALSTILAENAPERTEVSEEAPQRCQELRPHDPELFALKVIPYLQQDPEKVKSLALRFRDQSPQNGEGDYLMAWYAWTKERNPQSAKMWLKSAQKRDPNNERYQQTSARINQNAVGSKGLFTISAQIQLQEFLQD